MLPRSVHVLHQRVVRLIQHVGSVPVRSAHFQIGILIHIRVDGADPVPGVFLVERFQKLFQVALFLSLIHI